MSDVFKTYLNLEEADSKIRCTLEKIQLCIFYQIEADPVPSKVHFYFKMSYDLTELQITDSHRTMAD